MGGPCLNRCTARTALIYRTHCTIHFDGYFFFSHIRLVLVAISVYLCCSCTIRSTQWVDYMRRVLFAVSMCASACDRFRILVNFIRHGHTNHWVPSFRMLAFVIRIRVLLIRRLKALTRTISSTALSIDFHCNGSHSHTHTRPHIGNWICL